MADFLHKKLPEIIKLSALFSLMQKLLCQESLCAEKMNGKMLKKIHYR